MKTIKLTCFLCLVLLPSTIQGPFSFKDFVQMTDRGEELEYLGSGKDSIIYKVELAKSKKIVAMKITQILRSKRTPSVLNTWEYTIYSYMNAINNATVEDYGIPAVYSYHAGFGGYELLAITLLDPQFTKLVETSNNRLEDLDILIIMREFVRITKYIHSKGVCHNDLHLRNLMFRGNQGFIIDFDRSLEVNGRVDHESDCRKVDWQKIFSELCRLCGLTVDSENHEKTLENVKNMNNNNGLRSVLLLFADYAFKVKNAPPIDYNKMHEEITKVIRGHGVKEPALVSWLTEEQKNDVKTEWLKKQTPAIENIAEPKTHYNYPKPKLNYFE